GAISNMFQLVKPSVSVTSPAQGTSLQVGADTDITWSINGGGVYPAKVEVSRNGGTTWEDNGTIVPVGLEHKRTWHVSGPASTQAQVRVTLFDSTSNVQVGQSAVSGTFTIAGGSAANTPCAGPAASMVDSAPILWAVLPIGHSYKEFAGQNTHWVNGTS